jgi:hypothetical protein
VSESTDAVVGVYESMKDAESAVHTLLEHGVRAGQVSIVGQDLHSETHVHGFVTTGARPAPKVGRGSVGCSVC